jgi:hypothetical protein
VSFDCGATPGGSSAGFIHSSPRVATARCVLVGLRPYVSLPRCWTSLEMAGWRNLVCVVGG